MIRYTIGTERIIIMLPYFSISLDVAHPELPARAICAMDEGRA